MTRTRLLVVLALAASSCGGDRATGVAAAVHARRTARSPRGVAFVEWWALLDDGSLVTEDVEGRRFGSARRPAAPDEGLRRVVLAPDGAGAVVLTNRGRLHRAPTEGPLLPLDLRVQAGSFLATGEGVVWVAGEAGGLATFALDGRRLVEHWPTGDPPTTALVARGRRVLVGRAAGTVESGREGDPAARRTVARFDGMVTALALARDGRAAAAGGGGAVVEERARDGPTTAWEAGGTVVLLTFLEGSRAAAGSLPLLALREDGELVAGPAAGAGPRNLLRLGARVRSAAVVTDFPPRCGEGLVGPALRVATEAEDVWVEVTFPQ